MILLLLSVLANAQPELSIGVGEHASISRMPTIHPGLAELSLREVEGDLNLLQGRRTPSIKKIEVLYRGGGDWFLRILLVSERTRVQGSVEDGQLSLSVLNGAHPARAPIGEVPTLEELLYEDLPDEPGDVLPEPFFLHGDALAVRMPITEYALGFTTPGWLWGGTRADLDTARKQMLEARSCGRACEGALGDAIYEVGWRYMGLGWSREGFHYLNRLTKNPGTIPPDQILVSQAQAAIATRQFDIARQWLTEAADAGAPELAVVEGLAAISLVTGDPARAPTARKLASLTADPKTMLLVGEMLQLEDRFSESVPYLKKGLIGAEDDVLARTSLRLGDAALVAGDLDTAWGWWGDGPKSLSTYREIYGELYRFGASAWTAIEPQLNQLTSEQGQVAAEATYLLARIDGQLGIDTDAIANLTLLLDRHPRIGLASDAPERLWSIYKERVRRLHQEESWYRLAALHESGWRPVLKDYIDDPLVLWKVADAYEALGLIRPAIDVLTLGLESVLTENNTQPEMTLHLARLYQDSGSCADGLKTLNFLKGSASNLPVGEVALLTGDMLVSCDRSKEAIAHLQRALGTPAVADDARAILAQLDARAGRCPAAIPVLRRHFAREDVSPDSDAGLLLARCLAEEGALEEAAAVATAVATTSPSIEITRYASYLSSLYSGSPEDLEAGEDIWGSIAAERVAAESLDEVLKARQK